MVEGEQTFSCNLPAAAVSRQPGETALYSQAGQTIFQIIGANGAPTLIWESYPVDATQDGYAIDRSKGISRTKEEFESEQWRLRRGADA